MFDDLLQILDGKKDDARRLRARLGDADDADPLRNRDIYALLNMVMDRIEALERASERADTTDS